MKEISLDAASLCLCLRLVPCSFTAKSSSSSASLFQQFWLIDWLTVVDWYSNFCVWVRLAFHSRSGFPSLFHSLFLLLSVWFMLVCRVINAVYFISRQPAQWGNSTAAEMKNVKVLLSLSLTLAQGICQSWPTVPMMLHLKLFNQHAVAITTLTRNCTCCCCCRRSCCRGCCCFSSCCCVAWVVVVVVVALVVPLSCCCRCPLWQKICRL